MNTFIHVFCALNEIPKGENMVTTHNLGFPRIGTRRELKSALESYFRGDSFEQDLLRAGRDLRAGAQQAQASLDLVPVGDFSLYDHVLDLSFTLGNVPERIGGRHLADYFRLARGRAPGDEGAGTQAGEMTKWFDTNYHYIVPEFSAKTTFSLDAGRLVSDLKEVLAQGRRPKPVLVGPVTYLYLGKEKDRTNKWEILPDLLAVYRELLGELHQLGVEWVQMDEPVLVTECSPEIRRALVQSYEVLSYGGPRLLLGTYFGALAENTDLAVSLPVHGLHVDAVRGREALADVAFKLPRACVLSVGVVCGRNVWKTDLAAALSLLEPLRDARGERLWVAPSCSLLHVPVDLAQERELDPELKRWLAFAVQKVGEVTLLGRALNEGREVVEEELSENKRDLASRRACAQKEKERAWNALRRQVHEEIEERAPYPERRKLQKQVLSLPPLPTTTIGSFPQTKEIRSARQKERTGAISRQEYTELMFSHITSCVREQEQLGLDVLVHGEAERNDMVEYFGEKLDGFAITEGGWVQSYGSRCVKPPLLYGHVRRTAPITVPWIRFAQSLTERPVKGMLTGPVTVLNWSFVRDDQPRSVTCAELALALREEVLDLETAGIKIIQIDEAALREGQPLRRAEWEEYLSWAVKCFKITSSGVKDETQIHTHMCYSEFNDIIAAIAELDADVITIETSRSDMELLSAFDDFRYPNEIGPGVYDIHSPNTPSEEQIVRLMKRAAEKIPQERLWINPDCGLKTRSWAEVRPALENMVRAAKRLRSELF